MNAKVSIIVPVYNTEKYLNDCLSSILNHNYINAEVIIINDGSTDDSLKLCEQWALKDNRIQIINQKNQGQAAARNRGLDIATGEYIAFVDADDTVSKDLFLENIKILEQDTSIDFLQFPRYINYGTKTEQLIQNDEPQEVTKDYLYKSWLEDKIISWFIWDKIYRKELFDTLRFREGMIFEDNYLVADILEKANKAFISNKGVYNYWWRSNSTTTTTHNLKKDIDTQKVNLHILDKIKNLKNTNTAKTIIISRIFYVYLSMYKNFNSFLVLDNQFIIEFKKLSFVTIFKSKLPLKQISKLVLVKIIGVEFYLKNKMTAR